ncbi:protein-disulfide reductase DsbD domain-containing protein [Novispirillum itersonii]|uniref:Suppressor for copper-sensitivity B n=1 Tax=Novispirillum itersonii TaxID=189 RepID=A0A7X0DMF7_NOVIT|nr:protein-disulfide reductase DsbD domain-containing protein [Novispirillum itersonii]MBB6209132.1 suppressor for copper-sensitivity B [Novispirillum itersonii]
MTFLSRLLPSRRPRSIAPSRSIPPRLAALVAGIALGLGLMVQDAAADSARVETPQAAVSLIADRIAIDGAPSVRIGLRYDLKDDWKVYWRSPGDAGYPATLSWQGSDNTVPEQIRTDWPVPVRFSVLGIETLGYKHQVVFPLTVPVTDPTHPLRLRLNADYLICSEICVPGQVALALDLPADAPPDRQLLADAAASAHLIDQYAAQVPAPAGQGLSLSSLTLSTGSDGGQTITATVTALPPLTAPDLFIEGPVNGTTGLISGPPTVRPGPDGTTTLSTPLTTPLPVTALPPVRVTVADSGRGLDATLTPTVTTAAADSGGTTLLLILGLALLGGLILNIMPCVLPVLSLKLLHLVKAAGTERPVLRRSFLGTAAGIITTFLIMAGILTGLKLAGTAVGWGIQFQQPVFLAVMIVLLLLFAANLLGAFTLRLPGVIGDLAARPGGGAFANGVFATLLATPCSAPFLGTAVGFALARGPVEILAIFTALGLGMSLPYLAVAAAPGLATVLPRPGRWMATAKRVLALPLIGTALWLGSILLPQLLPAPAASPSVQGLWVRFAPDRIDTLVAGGQTVIVDVTADWCVTCKINKLTVLDNATILPRLSQPGVVAMQADWTRPDPVISAFLARYGRYGIPFNVVYGPGAPQGLPLPEILTPDALISALDKAKG